jgi:adenosylhomocysteine nucleosidase
MFLRLAACVLALFAGAACTRETEATQTTDACGSGPRVLVISAFPRELAPLLAAAREGKSLERGGARYTCAVLAAEPVLLSVVGIGPDRATRATVDALETFNVSAVVVSGIAGGLSKGVHIADVTIPERWARHDEAKATWFDVDAGLLSVARTQPRPSLQPCTDKALCAEAASVLVGGNGVTGARFVDDRGYAAEMAARLSAVVTDMETASIAEVAAERRVPFIAVRAVSDLVHTGRSEELVEQYEELAADNAAATTIALIERLPR